MDCGSAFEGVIVCDPCAGSMTGSLLSVCRSSPVDDAVFVLTCSVFKLCVPGVGSPCTSGEYARRLAITITKNSLFITSSSLLPIPSDQAQEAAWWWVREHECHQQEYENQTHHHHGIEQQVLLYNSQ